MQRHQLRALSREELIASAERAGVPRPRVLTQAELVDEILKRTAGSDRDRTRARGWLGKARDLIATVVEKGLHLPDAAAAIRNGPKGWPPPPPPLPTVTLAEIYAAQGHLERAVAVLEDVLRREPDHQEARELRERFLAQLARGPKSASDPPVSAAADTEPSRADASAAKKPEAEAAGAAEEEEVGGGASVGADAPRVDEKSSGDPPVHSSPIVASPSGQSAPPPAEEASPKRKSSAPPPAAEVSSKRKSSAPPPAEEASPKRKSSAPPPAEEEASTKRRSSAPPAGGLRAAAVSEAPADGGEAAAAAAEPTEATALSEAEEAAIGDEGDADAIAPPGELTDAEAAAAEAAAGEDAPAVTMPEHYDVDEVVALAVDPSTFYVYWEVRPTTFANMVARNPGGALALRVTAVTPGWEGPIIETRDVPIDALHGDHFIHHVRPRADVRVSVGWISDGRFDPIAIGAEVSAPRAFVAAGSPAPGGAPLDLSEGPHGTPEGFVRPVVFAPRERAATMLAAGWIPRELAGTVIEGAADQAPEDAGNGPASWIWVPGPVSEQVGMAVMFGPSTAQLPGSLEGAGDWQPGELRRDAEGGVWRRDSDGSFWHRDSEGGVWRRDAEGGSWRFVDEGESWSIVLEGGSWIWPTEGGSWTHTTGGSWGGASEGGRWGGSSEARWGGSSEARWGGSSERRWGGSSERRWGGASERRWGGASEGGRWGGASEGGRWGGASEGGRWGGSSAGGPSGGARKPAAR